MSLRIALGIAALGGGASTLLLSWLRTGQWLRYSLLDLLRWVVPVTLPLPPPPLVELLDALQRVLAAVPGALVLLGAAAWILLAPRPSPRPGLQHAPVADVRAIAKAAGREGVIVVSRMHPSLFDRLRRHLGRRRGVEVVMDRRWGERRRRVKEAAGERREGDRRTGQEPAPVGPAPLIVVRRRGRHHEREGPRREAPRAASAESRPGRDPMADRFALHTWTLDTTPLPEVLRIARATGWGGVELRRIDFARARAAGRTPEDVLDLIRASGLPVACVGVEIGWMFAAGEERRRLLAAFEESCRWAAALRSTLVMSSVDRGRGEASQAAASVREAGDIAAAHGVRLALELNSQAEQLNTLGRVRDVLALADHPACGLLLDTYHLHRSGCAPGALEDVAPAQIVYVQYSDVPRAGLAPGQVLDRLPPGQGSVPFAEFCEVLTQKAYAGYLSYEAPNLAAWGRDPEAVAREALVATRAVLRLA
jgi:2-keto-myo-inositol isomerase